MRFRKKDFEIDWFSGTGGGGQYRNKHQNCCRITHKATGLRAQSTKHRERPANQKAAFTRLAHMLVAYYSASDEVEINKNEVRVYKEPINAVIDATGARGTYSEVVGKGKIGPLIEARRKTLA